MSLINNIGAQYAGTVEEANIRYAMGQPTPISGDETTTDATAKAIRSALEQAGAAMRKFAETMAAAAESTVRALGHMRAAVQCVTSGPRNRHKACKWREAGDFDVCQHGQVQRYSGKPVLLNGRKPR